MNLKTSAKFLVFALVADHSQGGFAIQCNLLTKIVTANGKKCIPANFLFQRKNSSTIDLVVSTVSCYGNLYLTAKW